MNTPQNNKPSQSQTDQKSGYGSGKPTGTQDKNAPANNPGNKMANSHTMPSEKNNTDRENNKTSGKNQEAADKDQSKDSKTARS